MGDLLDVIGYSWRSTHGSTESDWELSDVVKQRKANLLGAVINDGANLAHPSIADNKIDRNVHAQADDHMEFRAITAVVASPDLKSNRELSLFASTVVVDDALLT